MIELMRPTDTLAESEIQGGDIICFQVAVDQVTSDLGPHGLYYSNPVQFYNFLQNRVVVIFRPKFGEPGGDQPEFTLGLNKKQDYDAVSYPPLQ